MGRSHWLTEFALMHRRIALAALTAPRGCRRFPPPLRGQSPAWPAKPVTWVVPFPAGVALLRAPLTAVLTRQTGHQFIIDNKGGAGGTLGAGIAAKAAPDGYTFFMGAVHHAIAPAMYPKLDYKLERPTSSPLA